MSGRAWYERSPSTTKETRYKCRHRPCEGAIWQLNGVYSCSDCGEFWYPPRRRPKPAPPPSPAVTGPPTGECALCGRSVPLTHGQLWWKVQLFRGDVEPGTWRDLAPAHLVCTQCLPGQMSTALYPKGGMANG